MFRDYHYLLRCITELRQSINGFPIVEIYSQEKDKLYFHIPSDEHPHQHLIISCDPQLPYLHLRKELHKAKKNTLNFFTEILPAIIGEIRIAADDRIINISSDTTEFMFLVRGSKSNLISLNHNGSLLSFKNLHGKEIELKEEINDNVFITEYEEHDLNISDEISYSEIRKTCPFVSKKLFSEITTSNHNSGASYKDALNSCIHEILESQILIGTDSKANELTFQPANFIRSELSESKDFNNYNDAIAYYVSNYYSSKKYQQLYKSINDFVDKQLEILSNRLNNLKVRLEHGCKDEVYYGYGRLLLNNLNNITSGTSEAIVNDYISGKEIIIKLDPKLNVQGNANYYFEKAKDEKKNFFKSKELYDSSKIKYETYIKFRNEIKSSSNLEDLLFFKEQLNIKEKSKSHKVDEQINYREYVIEGKYRIFVGKDSKSNDLLTVKFAKQNDYWFHARGYSGSHVVLRVDNPKEVVPKHILNYAASIAAYYSKAKTAKVAPVAYTLKKYVRKNKNMNVGQVIVTKEKVLLVKPEIPVKAEEVDV